MLRKEASNIHIYAYKKKKLPMKYTFKFIIKRKNFNSLSICLLFLEALSRKQLNKIYYVLEIKSSQIFMNFRKRREREKQSIKYNVFTLYNFIFHRSICVCVCISIEVHSCIHPFHSPSITHHHTHPCVCMCVCGVKKNIDFSSFIAGL